MRSRIWKLTAGAATLSALALVGALTIIPSRCVQGQQKNSRENKAQEGKLEGTWRVQVSLRNCQTGAEIRAATPALITFANDGTVTETTTVFPPAMRGAGHGFWRSSGWRTYTAVSECFLFDPSAPTTSSWIGTQRITQMIKLADNPDELNSTATVDFFGPDGKPVAGYPPSGCSTAVARRMQ
jgi:hypothetical protein